MFAIIPCPCGEDQVTHSKQKIILFFGESTLEAMDQKKLEKFINHLNTLIETLESHRRDAAIQRQTNQYYFMQKEAELRLLYEQIENASKRLKFTEDTFNKVYSEVFIRWRKESRWVNQYLQESPFNDWFANLKQNSPPSQGGVLEEGGSKN
jgi:hypothetical protein